VARGAAAGPIKKPRKRGAGLRELRPRLHPQLSRDRLQEHLFWTPRASNLCPKNEGEPRTTWRVEGRPFLWVGNAAKPRPLKRGFAFGEQSAKGRPGRRSCYPTGALAQKKGRSMWRKRRRSAFRDAPPSWACEPWVKADLFFLQDSLRHEMSFAEVAGFLRRTEDEVRAKAEDLNYLQRQRRA
jgi:hypothetical protein